MKREKKIRPYVPSRRKIADPDAITFTDLILEKFRQDWYKESLKSNANETRTKEI